MCIAQRKTGTASMLPFMKAERTKFIRVEGAISMSKALLRTNLSVALFAASLLVAFPGTARPYDGVCATPEHVKALPPGTWCVVPDSKLADAEKSPQEWGDWNGSSSASYDSYQRVSGIRGITAFSGGAYDGKRDRLLIMGGGHNDYGGNEIMAFSLQTLSWERLTDPTAFPNRKPSTENDDGTPISRHTYKAVEYIPDRDALFIFGGAPDSSGGGCGLEGAWLYDLRAREVAATYRPEQWSRISSGSEPDNGCDVQAIYDGATGRVLYNSHLGWYELDLATERWKQLNSASFEQRKTFALIPGAASFLVHIGGGKFDGYMKRDLLSADLSGTEVATSGDRTLEESSAQAFAFDNPSGKIVGWKGGADIYALDLSDNQWSRHAPAAMNLVNPGSAATVYGRFRYSPVSNVYIAVDSVYENVLLYRFEAGAGKPLDPQPNPPENLTAE